jgi:coenzyme F420-0:L-glutamate ligase/coenzyme F420-1:gamma-L-glutamate ligase
MREIRAGDSLAEEILRALGRQRLRLEAGDVLVVTHKIVSKAEGRVVRLRDVKPTRPAQRWARRYGLDARVVELALRESVRVVRMQHGVLITETAHGLVCANSGVDVSNVDGGRSAVLLPEDPDRSAARLREEMRKKTGRAVAVLITDSFGRPWREGLCQVAIGLAGMKATRDFRGRRDPRGYRLRVTEEAVADELASLAALAGDKLSRTPVCLVRGVRYPRGQGRARDLVRPAKKDLFR